MDPRVFCGKIMPNDSSECERAYRKMIDDNVKYSDGGVFNQSMDSVMDYLERLEGEARDFIDVQKLQETIK